MQSCIDNEMLLHCRMKDESIYGGQTLCFNFDSCSINMGILIEATLPVQPIRTRFRSSNILSSAISNGEIQVVPKCDVTYQR